MSRRGYSDTSFLRASAVVTAAPLTMAAWAKTSILATAQNIIGLFKSTAATDLDQFIVRVGVGNNIIARTGDAASVNSSTSSGTITANTWFHAGGVFASATSRIAYLNGVAATADTTSRTPSGIDRTSIGNQDNTAQGKAWGIAGIGDIAEAAVWNVALTAGEMAALAAGTNPRQIRPANLVGYWPLFGHYAPENNLADPSKTLTLVGTTMQPGPNPPVSWSPKLIHALGARKIR